MKHTTLLWILFVYTLFATILGWWHVLHGNFSGHSIAFFPLGIFVWGDAAIIGLFLMIASLVLLTKKQIALTGLVFSLYFSIRWFIEALYGLMAQFSEMVRPWERFFIELPLLRGISYLEMLVLYQVLATCFFILSFLGFLFFLKKYVAFK